MDNTELNQGNSEASHSTPPIEFPIEKPGKVNLGKAIKLYFERNVPQCDIARIMNVSDQCIDQALKPYKQILFSKGEIDVLRTRKEDLIEGSFYRLLLDTTDPAKREAASLNNTAFALDKVHQIMRLETDQSTSNTAISMRMDPSSSKGLNRASRRHRLKMVDDPSSDSRVLGVSDEG
jgi:hypothetical protein